MKFALAFLLISALVAVISAEFHGRDNKEISGDDQEIASPLEYRMRRSPGRREASSESQSESEEKPRRKAQRKPKHYRGRGRSSATTTGSGEARYLQHAIVENGIYPAVGYGYPAIVRPYASPYSIYGKK